jgi:hypothetical protein
MTRKAFVLHKKSNVFYLSPVNFSPAENPTIFMFPENVCGFENLYALRQIYDDDIAEKSYILKTTYLQHLYFTMKKTA